MCSVTSTPGKPCSAKVGISGASGLRSREAMASGRKVAPRICGSTPEAAWNTIGVSPAITACTAGPPPR